MPESLNMMFIVDLRIKRTDCQQKKPKCKAKE